MAVYTPLTFAAVADFLERFDCGALQQLQPIEGGIENTNFFVTTSGGEFVLTLFERIEIGALRYCLEWMRHLQRHALPVPQVFSDSEGEFIFTLQAKPAALVQRLPGQSQMQPDATACTQLGDALAQMHLAAQSFTRHQPNPRGVDWMQQTAEQVRPYLNAPQAALLQQQAQFLQDWHAHASTLSGGAIHADLFRNNALFLPEGKLSGIFDFYFAGSDAFVLDLAICLNDWCIDLVSGVLHPARVQALLQTYERVRPLSAAERQALPAALRLGALRFWLSRLADWYLPRAAQLLQPHDPEHFERILKLRINNKFSI